MSAREALEHVHFVVTHCAEQQLTRLKDPDLDEETRLIADGAWAAYTTMVNHIEKMIAESFSDDPGNIIDASALFGGSKRAAPLQFRYGGD